MKPDWSYQDRAVADVLHDFRYDESQRLGLIIPTGGGKTRIALRICDEVISSSEGSVLWVTHRSLLKNAVEKDCNNLIKNKVIKNKRFIDNIDVCLLSEANQKDYSNYSLIVVDEAHRSAASSYSFLEKVGDEAKVLLLTATPNRSDGQSIGIEKVSFERTYSQLFSYGVILKPRFIPLDVPNFNYNDEKTIDILVENIFINLNTSMNKMMVLSSKIEDVIKISERFLERISKSEESRIQNEDVYVFYGGSEERNQKIKSSQDASFGVIFTTQQLVGEGYDDRLIDSVLLTYPSESIIVKMQSAGRAMRYHEEKERCYLLEVRNNNYAYYFDSFWIDSDLSDYLKPEVIQLENHNDVVRFSNLYRVKQELTPELTYISIIFSEEYLYNEKDFYEKSHWHLLNLNKSEYSYLKNIINKICKLKKPILNPRNYLSQFSALDDDFIDKIIPFVVILGRSIDEKKGLVRNRGYKKGGATTWWKIIKYKSNYLGDLEEFLSNCINKDVVIRSYCSEFYLFKIPCGYNKFKAGLTSKIGLELFLDDIKNNNDIFSKSYNVSLDLLNNYTLLLSDEIRKIILYKG